MAPEIEVRLLGPVEIAGAARPLRRAGALELVVYLALHPGAVDNDVWATAIWPERFLAPSTLHSIASEARRGLGRSAGGLDHLPRSRGRLCLGPGVGTDWERFWRLGRSGCPDEGRRALELLRGAPFGGLKHQDWTVLEGFRAEIEQEVGRVAAEVGRRALAGGRTRQAREAARRGLTVSPYDERLYRVLMEAADLEGNPAGVRATVSELLGALGSEEAPQPAPARLRPEQLAGLVHPETLRLCQSLLAPSPSARPAHPGPPRRSRRATSRPVGSL